MGLEHMAEKDMAAAVAAEEVAAAAGEEGAAKQEERVGEGEEGELLVKSVPNDELNSKVSHDVVPGDVDESVVAVAGSVDESVEASVSTGTDADTVPASVDPEPAPSSDVVGATEKVESWDLSEAVAKTGQGGNEKEDLKPKISEGGSPEGVDTEGAPVVSIDSTDDSVAGEPVFVSTDVEDRAEGSEHAGGLIEVPSEVAGSEDVSSEIPGEGSTEKVESKAVDIPVEEAHEVVEATTSAEPDENPATLETVPSPSDDAEEKPIQVNSGDVGEVASILPSESVDNEDESSEIPAEGPSDNVDSKALEAPVDSEGFKSEVVDGVMELTTSAETDEGSAEPESASAPVDVQEKSVEVNSEDPSDANKVLPSESAENEDVSPELPAEGSSDSVDSKALEAPVDSEGFKSEVVDGVMELTTSAETDEGSAEPESMSAPVDDVKEKSREVNSEDTSEATIAEADEGSAEPESASAPVDVQEKSVEVNSEDPSDANKVLPSESAENEDVSPELPAEGPSDSVDSEARETPVDSERLDAQVGHEVVEATTSAAADDGSELESVSAPAGDVKEKPVEVNSEDPSESNTVLPSESADSEDVSPELPAEGSVDNVGSEALFAPIEEVHEVAEATISAEPAEGSAEPEFVSVPPADAEDKSVEVDSGDISEATTALESADNEVAGSDLPTEESAENVSSEALEPEAVHEVVELATSAEPTEESAELEPVPAPDHVADKSLEVNAKDTSEAATVLPSESADNEVVSSELPAYKIDQIGEAKDVPIGAKPDEESIEPEFVSAPPDIIEDKSVDVNSKDVAEAITESETANNEAVSSELLAEESPDNISSDALGTQALHEVVEARTSEEPVEVSAEPESASAPSDDVEDKSIDVNSENVTEVTTASEGADNEGASLEPSVEEPSGNVGSEVLYAPVEEVHEVVEATISAEPKEDSAEPESEPALSDDVDDGFVMVNSRDVAEASTELGSFDNEIVSPELPAEVSADNVTNEAVEPEAVHEMVEPTTSAEPNEESAEPESLSAVDDVEDKSVEVISEDTNEAVPVLPSESAENEVVSRELPAVGSAEKIEISEIEDAVINANPDEASASLESVAVPSGNAQSTPKEVEPEVSAPEMEEKSTMATSPPLPAGYEHEQSEVSNEGSAENGVASIGVDTVTNTKENDTVEHTSEESLGGATSGDVPNNPQVLSSEEPSDLSSDSHQESLSAEDGIALVDRCIQVEELPQDSAAESQRSVSMDAEVNVGDEEGSAEGDDIIKEESPETQSVSSNEDPSVEDVSHLLQTVMTDEEVKLAAAHHPENSVASEESVEDETPALGSENLFHGESSVPPAESFGASQANEVETVSREFNFNDFNEAPTTSEVVRELGDESHDAGTSKQVTPYLATALATASGEKVITSDPAASDTNPLKVSSPPPVAENEVAPRSYNLDEVATKLHDAAEKTLEDAKSSDIGDKPTSVAQSVAQIVLDESSKTGDSSEYIAEVVQHVAQLAQDAGSSDPNILPDTVARVFDGETAGSPANGTSQTKETTSLGTMVSLFIVWCVSLCASHISSKDMPAPALKLAAEEVTAVLHSNAPSQAASSHEAASLNIE